MLRLALLLAAQAGAPALSPSDQTALFTAACGWLETGGVDVAERTCAAPSSNRWTAVRPGRFAEGDGEWLVSLEEPCLGHCRGTTFAARRTTDGWRSVGREDDVVSDECLTLRGPDGWDRVACLETEGPKQGFLAHSLRVLSLRPGVPSRTLLEKDHGGECWLAEPPEKAEFDDDGLSDLAPGEPGSDTVLTLRLAVVRGECDREVEDPQETATVRGTHTLRFVRSGDDVVPDAPSAVLIDELGWKPERR